MVYRREIDGLRAMAVLPVVLFHAGFKLFSGGFVGVDVFFVISGYLITSIIIADLEKNKFSIANFYERRARRILPALFLVMAVTIPLAWFLLFPSDMKEFSQSVASVSLFSSNILFLRQSGYFSASAELKPLLHTWSLALEEQFYLFFPLLLMFAWRHCKKWLAHLVLLITAISFAIALNTLFKKPDAAFFLLPSRGWELTVGACAALYSRKQGRTNFPGVFNQVLSLMGLSLILFSIMAYDHTTPWPGPSTLAPTIGAALILLCAWPDTLVGQILSWQGFVGVGLISYSTYLWHQPLFAFARHQSLMEPDAPVFILLIAVTFLLAYLSWKFVERPFRENRQHWLLRRRGIFISALTASILFIILGLTLDNTQFYNKHLRPDQQKLLSFLNYTETQAHQSAWRSGQCFLHTKRDDFKYFDKTECLKLSPTKLNYLLIGDSHAAHFIHGLAVNFPNVNFLQATSSGCSPLLNPQGKKRCQDLVNYIFNEFLAHNKIDGVILAARWGEGDFPALKKTIAHLGRDINNIYVFGPTVEYIRPLPMILVKANGLYNQSIPMDSPYLDHERIQLAKKMPVLLQATKAHYLDTMSAICENKQCLTMTQENEPMAFDYGHFTLSASAYVVTNLVRRGFIRP